MSELSNTLAYAEGFLNADRKIILASSTNEQVLEKVATTLIMLETQEIKPITIIIETRGGTGGFYLKNVIDTLRSEVHGLVIGKAASMGALILQMCAKRMMMPHSTLWLHNCKYTTQLETGYAYAMKGTDKDLIYNTIKKTNEDQIGLIMKRTGNSKKTIKEIFRQCEVYNHLIDAKEALKLNLIDEIITDFKLYPANYIGSKVKKKE